MSMTRKYITPVEGKVYKNHNGRDYRCTASCGGSDAWMERLTDHWTLLAHGVQQYEDGTIQWDWSSKGHWPARGEKEP